MKFALFFLFCCVAFVAAAPQFITYPGFVGTTGLLTRGAIPATGTVVAGPTVVNAAPWGGLAHHLW